MTDLATDRSVSNDTAEALVERLFAATPGALELLSVYLGWRLGLYRDLHEGGPASAAELADRASIDQRYAREWLEQQAAAGFLTVDDPTAAADDRRYALPAGHTGVLLDPTDLSHLAPIAAMVVGIADACRRSSTPTEPARVSPTRRYGADFREGQGAINRPGFHHDLAGWVRAVPDIDSRLRGLDARVIDVGCGQGWSTIALARAYPDAEVVGIDTDPASITDAIANAGRAGVDVTFQASNDIGDGPVDLVCVFEALHDMADPIAVLESARRRLAPGGVVLLVDEKVADEFQGPADAVERMMYGWSVLHCLPVARAEQPSAALGTVLRRPTVEQLASKAGFSCVVLDIDHDSFRLYRLDP